jgi:MFS family permease
MNERAAGVVALCSVTFLQAYLLVGVFPYAAFMAIQFLQIQEEQAGPYAALFATSFMIGRTMTAHLWGLLADVYGRRFAMICSLVGSGLASLWFGMANSYSQAIVARGMIGAWNSIVGVSKTVATEFAFHNFDDCNNQNREAVVDENADEQQQLETRIVGRVMSMRAYGYLLAPGIAGFLADPLDVREKGVAHVASIGGSNALRASCYKLLSKYPYLLPNLLGAVLCWASASMVYLFIPETMPSPRSAQFVGTDFVQWARRMFARLKCSKSEAQVDASIPLTAAEASSASDNSSRQYGSIQNKTKSDSISSSSLKLIWSRRKTRNHLIAYWLYSLIIINIDEAFPLYCISRNTGLGGLQEHDIGKILSASGVIFAIGQYKIYLMICDHFGVYGSLDLGCWLGVLPVALFPLASFVYTTANKRWSMLYLALLSGVTKIFQSAFFSSITVTTNRTVPAEMRSRMNALGSIGAGISKAFGPLIVGVWMAFCLSLDDQDDSNSKVLPIGSLLAWFGIAFVSGLSMFAILRSL